MKQLIKSLTNSNFNIMAQTFERWLAESTGYECKTTFWMDFSIAESFGVTAIKDTYRMAFREWKHNVVFLTELAMVLNHKSWYHFDAWREGKDCHHLVRLYTELFLKVDNYAKLHLKGDELEYYYVTTD